MSFFIPAAIAIATALFLVNRLRDTPTSLGLPPIEEYKNDPTGEKEVESGALSTREILWENVLRNKYIWALALGNFFVYIVRYGAMDWAPAFLVEVKGANIQSAGFKVASFEVTGILGAFIAGYVSDRFLKGRRGPLNVLYMTLLAGSVALFWLTPPDSHWLDYLTLSAVGFLVYGPQMLVGVSAADVVSKNAAATATGFTGMGGYLGGIVAGIGAGAILDKWGWDGGFKFFIACALLGALCFGMTWKKSARKNGSAA
jgi:OPA family glycerol-3-phosphate transporter-like MFS transporter